MLCPTPGYGKGVATAARVIPLAGLRTLLASTAFPGLASSFGRWITLTFDCIGPRG